MGGIQARAGSVAEVHAVRGGQLILRVSPSQTSSQPAAVNTRARRKSSFRGIKYSWVMDDVGNAFVIAYHGHCFLLDQSMDILEKILLWLTPRDLALLSLTSKTLNRIVLQFVEHHISSQGLKYKMRQFYLANEKLLLPKEIVLRDRVASNVRPELLLYSAMRQFLGAVRRINLAEEFLRQNQSDRDVYKELDVSLKRDLLILKRSSRSVKFTYTFKNIPQGKYIIQMRMRIITAPGRYLTHSASQVRRLTAANAAKKATGRIRVSRISENCQYNSSLSTLSSINSESDQAASSNHYQIPGGYVQAQHNASNQHQKQSGRNHNNNNGCEQAQDGGQRGETLSRPSTPPPSPIANFKVEELISQSIDAFWWYKIVEHSDYRSYLTSSEVVYDRDSDWFSLRLKSFKIPSESDLEFEYLDNVDDETDVSLLLLRQTMVWDFLELRQLVKAP